MDTATNNTCKDDLRNTLYAHALRLTKNNYRLAQELLQETLSQIAHNATAYSTLESFTAQACKAMTRIYLTTMREADIHELHQLCYTPHGTPCTPAEIIHAMSRLTPQQAAVVTLRLKGYSHSQIARATGHTTQWVNSNMLKACQRLRNTWSN